MPFGFTDDEMNSINALASPLCVLAKPSALSAMPLTLAP
jgi:hypothetical protein